ncbi:MAG: hypothetical protein U9P44_04310, partial [archaeon]|nr:hypothetical protein [archaeon]
AIQIISHDVESNFYRPSEIISGIHMSKGFGWSRKGRFIEKLPKAKGLGPEGMCKCEICGYEIQHKKGIPCSKLKCPKCKSHMTRS